MSMNNVFVYCEIDGLNIPLVTYELLSEGRRLATALGVQLEAIAVGDGLKSKIEAQLVPYGVDRLCVVDEKHLHDYLTAPFADVVGEVLAAWKPQIALFPATFEGGDLAPRVAARLCTGLTAHCTRLAIADYTDPVTGETKHNLLHQVRPALGGNIEATILTPQTLPQMATVIPGSFVPQRVDEQYDCEIVYHAHEKTAKLSHTSLVSLEDGEQAGRNSLSEAKVVVCGGYGVGSEKNFRLLHELATAMGGEVAATRAAVDAGWAEREVQIGQTGHTIRPSLFIACGCSGALQFTSGMKDSATIVSINTDPDAPMNALADYVVIGRIEEIVPKMIQQYKEKK